MTFTDQEKFVAFVNRLSNERKTHIHEDDDDDDNGAILENIVIGEVPEIRTTTSEEIQEIMKQMELRKTPRNDEISNRSLKSFRKKAFI